MKKLISVFLLFVLLLTACGETNVDTSSQDISSEMVSGKVSSELDETAKKKIGQELSEKMVSMSDEETIFVVVWFEDIDESAVELPPKEQKEEYTKARSQAVQEHNKKIISTLPEGLEIDFESKYAPMIYAFATKAQINEMATNEKVYSIDYFEDKPLTNT